MVRKLKQTAAWVLAAVLVLSGCQVEEPKYTEPVDTKPVLVPGTLESGLLTADPGNYHRSAADGNGDFWKSNQVITICPLHCCTMRIKTIWKNGYSSATILPVITMCPPALPEEHSIPFSAGMDGSGL